MGNERTVATAEGLKEGLAVLTTGNLSNEDLDALRDALNLLELLEPVPSTEIELTVELSLSGRRGADAAVTSSVGAGAEESSVVRLVPDGEAASTVLNKDRDHAGDELGKVGDLGVDASWLCGTSLSDTLVGNAGHTPCSSDTSDSELDLETTGTGGLGQVDVAVKLLQRPGTTAGVEEVEVEHRADASSTHRLDLIEGLLALSVVGTVEDGVILSAELHAALHDNGLVLLRRLGTSVIRRNALDGLARANALDGKVDAAVDASNTLLTTADLSAERLLLVRSKAGLLEGKTLADDTDVSADQAFNNAGKIRAADTATLASLSIGETLLSALDAASNLGDLSLKSFLDGSRAANLELDLSLKSSEALVELPEAASSTTDATSVASTNASSTTADTATFTSLSTVETTLDALELASNLGSTLLEASLLGGSNTSLGEASLEGSITSVEPLEGTGLAADCASEARPAAGSAGDTSATLARLDGSTALLEALDAASKTVDAALETSLADGGNTSLRSGLPEVSTTLRNLLDATSQTADATSAASAAGLARTRLALALTSLSASEAALGGLNAAGIANKTLLGALLLNSGNASLGDTSTESGAALAESSEALGQAAGLASEASLAASSRRASTASLTGLGASEATVSTLELTSNACSTLGEASLLGGGETSLSKSSLDSSTALP